MDTSEGAVAVGAVVVVKIFGLCSDIFFCFCFFLWRLGKQMDRPSLSCSLDKYHYNPLCYQMDNSSLSINPSSGLIV